MYDGDPTTPPMFACEKCSEQMYPEYYKGVYGIEYKISGYSLNKKRTGRFLPGFSYWGKWGNQVYVPDSPPFATTSAHRISRSKSEYSLIIEYSDITSFALI